MCWKSAQEYIGASYSFMKLCLKVSRFWVATMSWGETKNILKGLHGLQPCLTVVGHFLYHTFPSSPISKLLILLQGLLKFHFSVRKMTWAFRLSGTGPIEGQRSIGFFNLALYSAGVLWGLQILAGDLKQIIIHPEKVFKDIGAYSLFLNRIF